jgi:uncharacterized small protein (DUF1192 family)
MDNRRTMARPLPRNGQERRTGRLMGENAMDSDDLLPAKKTDLEIGGDLSLLSVGELEARIELLKGEIGRLEADIRAKKSSRSAAESIFKS